MFWKILLDIICRMLLIGLDGTPPAYLTLHFKVSSQDSSKFMSKYTLEYSENAFKSTSEYTAQYTSH